MTRRSGITGRRTADFYTDHFFDSRMNASHRYRNEALKMKLDTSERQTHSLGEELHKTEEKMKSMRGKMTKAERQSFKAVTDLDSAQQQIAELSTELDEAKRLLLEKTTVALIESKRSEDLQEKARRQDEDIVRITKQVERQQEELQDLRRGATKYLETREMPSWRRQESDEDLAIRAEAQELELRATKEQLEKKSREVEELQQKIQAQANDFTGTTLRQQLSERDRQLSEARAEVMELRQQQLDGGGTRSRPQMQEVPSVHDGERLSGAAEVRPEADAEEAQDDSDHEGLQVYNDSMVSSGAQSYRQSLSRHSPMLSLEEIAAAPLTPYVRQGGSGTGEGASATYALSGRLTSSRPDGEEPRRRGSSNSRSPRNARSGNHTATMGRAWSMTSDGDSSSDDDTTLRRRNARKPQISSSALISSPGQNLEELQKRLKSFKADTAANILGKSQAAKNKLRRMQSIDH